MKKSFSIYNISSEMAHIIDLLEEEENDRLEEEDSSNGKNIERLQRWFEVESHRANERLDDMIAGIKTLEAMADRRKEAAKEMNDLAKTDERQANVLRQSIIDHLDSIGESKVKTDLFSISLRSASSAPLNVSIPAKSLPIIFQNVIVNADKAAIKKALNDGEIVDGCWFGEKTRFIVIK